MDVLSKQHHEHMHAAVPLGLLLGWQRPRAESGARRMDASPVEARFWSKVSKSDGCWEWQAGRTSGYGRFWLNGHQDMAHRVAYALSGGTIPQGLQLDHLCRNRACVNPAHLEPVTSCENALRGFGVPAINARKTHCVHGHEFAGDNLGRAGNTRKGRRCKTCANHERARYNARRQDANRA